jgi:arylsulfatase
LAQPGTVINELFAHEDLLTTLMAAVGEPQVSDKLKEGETVGGATYKVHLDGYDQRDLLAMGNGTASARSSFTGPMTAM